MEYMGGQDFWNDKFKSKEDRLMAPEKELVDAAEILKKGTALDVACGDGRNSIYLLSKGFDVTSVDFSEEALKRLESFAKKDGYTSKTKQLDLSKDSWLTQIESFDNIVICHYRLSAKQLNGICEHINKDGILFVTGFGHKHIADERIRETDRIMPEDFKALDGCMERLDYHEYEDDRGAFVTYLFRKK